MRIKHLHMDVSKLTVEDVAEIKDQDQLLEIAKNSELDIRIRIKAFDDIEDKGIFRDYAYDEDSFLRMCAVKYVDDEVLLDLILNDSNDFVSMRPEGVLWIAATAKNMRMLFWNSPWKIPNTMYLL